MHHTSILFLPLLAMGCATPHPVAEAAPSPAVVAVASPTKTVETRYDLRGYRETANPAIRHDAHAVYRITRVPLSASDDPATASSAASAPVSYAPLPASEELAAEIATQKAITANLRALQIAVAETEQRVQAHYAALVRQSAAAHQVREQLEAERARVRGASKEAGATVSTGAPGGNPPEVKW